jgi:hypothetical protein
VPVSREAGAPIGQPRGSGRAAGARASSARAGSPARPAGAAQPAPGLAGSRGTVADTGCTPAEREAALRALQEAVLEAVSRHLDSLERAVRPGGPLAGWRLSHGHVVLATAGAVAGLHLPEGASLIAAGGPPRPPGAPVTR